MGPLKKHLKSTSVEQNLDVVVILKTLCKPSIMYSM